MKKLVKVSGSFDATNPINNPISLTVPAHVKEVALRLYDKGMTIAIWGVHNLPASDSDSILLASPLTRSFEIITGEDLPANFVKYIGSLLVGGVDAHVIEVSTAAPSVILTPQHDDPFKVATNNIVVHTENPHAISDVIESIADEMKKNKNRI